MGRSRRFGDHIRPQTSLVARITAQVDEHVEGEFLDLLASLLVMARTRRKSCMPGSPVLPGPGDRGAGTEEHQGC